LNKSLSGGRHAGRLTQKGGEKLPYTNKDLMEIRSEDVAAVGDAELQGKAESGRELKGRRRTVRRLFSKGETGEI